MNFVKYASALLDELDGNAAGASSKPSVTQAATATPSKVQYQQQVPIDSNDTVNVNEQHAAPATDGPVTQSEPDAQSDTNNSPPLDESKQHDMTTKPLTKTASAISLTSTASKHAKRDISSNDLQTLLQSPQSAAVSSMRSPDSRASAPAHTDQQPAPMPSEASSYTVAQPVTQQAARPPIAPTSSNTVSSDVSRLQLQVRDLQAEIASLNSVWDETRRKLAKAKDLLVSKEERHIDTIKQLEVEWQARMDEQHADYEQQLREMKLQMDETQKQFESTLYVKQEFHQTSTAELDTANARNAQLQQDIERLKDQLGAADIERDEVQAAHAEVIANHTQAIQALRNEHYEREQQLEQQVRDLSTQVQKLQFQQINNSSTGDDLSQQYAATIANIQRQLDDKVRQYEREITAKRWLEQDYESVQGQVAILKRQLEQTEKQLSTIGSSHQNELSVLQQQNAKLSSELQQAQQQHAQQRQQRIAAETSLSSPTTSPSQASTSATTNTELEARLKSMADNLLSKAQLIDRLMTEKSTLKVQLENAMHDIDVLEKRIDDMKSAGVYGDVSDDTDNELEAGNALRTLRRNASNNRNAHLNKRRPANVVTLSNPTLQKALQTVDTFVAQSLGLALRRYPLARIGCIAYVVVLHLWVLVILSHFIHHDSIGSGSTTLELPDEPGEIPFVSSKFS